MTDEPSLPEGKFKIKFGPWRSYDGRGRPCGACGKPVALLVGSSEHDRSPVMLSASDPDACVGFFEEEDGRMQIVAACSQACVDKLFNEGLPADYQGEML